LEAPDVNLAGKLGWVTAVYDHTYVVKFAIPERMIVSSICVERHEIDWIQNFIIGVPNRLVSMTLGGKWNHFYMGVQNRLVSMAFGGK